MKEKAGWEKETQFNFMVNEIKLSSDVLHFTMQSRYLLLFQYVQPSQWQNLNITIIQSITHSLGYYASKTFVRNWVSQSDTQLNKLIWFNIWLFWSVEHKNGFQFKPTSILFNMPFLVLTLTLTLIISYYFAHRNSNRQSNCCPKPSSKFSMGLLGFACKRFKIKVSTQWWIVIKKATKCNFIKMVWRIKMTG